MSRLGDPRRFLQIERQRQISRQVVQRSAGKNRQLARGSGQRAHRTTDRPVAAGNQNPPRSVGDRRSHVLGKRRRRNITNIEVTNRQQRVTRRFGVARARIDERRDHVSRGRNRRRNKSGSGGRKIFDSRRRFLGGGLKSTVALRSSL